MKKYNTRKEITDKINSVLVLQKSKSELAEHHGKLADKQFADSAIQKNSGDAGTLIKFAQENRTMEKKLLKQIKSYPKKLERLKNTLACYDTKPMEFVDDSVMECKA